MIRVIVQPEVTKFPSEALLMDYQKDIRFSFVRLEEEIRLNTAPASGDFPISAETRQCRFATQTKSRNSADRSHRNPVFPPCSQDRA